jgi:hypothetical protein
MDFLLFLLGPGPSLLLHSTRSNTIIIRMRHNTMLERNDFLIKDLGCGVVDLAGIQVDPSSLLLRPPPPMTSFCRFPPRRWCPLQQDIGVGPWRLFHGKGTKFLITKFLITKFLITKFLITKVLSNKVPNTLNS